MYISFTGQTQASMDPLPYTCPVSMDPLPRWTWSAR